MHCLILSQLSSISKIISAVDEADITFDVINSDPAKTYEYVPDNPDNINVFANIYSEGSSKTTKYTRFINGFPRIASLSKHFSSLTKRVENTRQFDFILANWGVGIIPELNMLKSVPHLREVKSILNLESFPTSWDNKIREQFEIIILKRSLSNIDAIIVPTKEMLDFLTSIIPEISEKKVYLRPFFFPNSHFKSFENEVEPIKDLLFLGRLNMTKQLNDVYHQIMDITKYSISVSSAEGSNSKEEHLYFYPPFKGAFLRSGGLYKLAHDHKAALVTYNYSDLGQLPARYQTSLPHRMLMPLALGIPIVLPKNRFKAMEELVVKHEVGIAYDSIEELRDFLYTDKWKLAKSKLQKNLQNFQFDPDGFKSFILTLIS